MNKQIMKRRDFLKGMGSLLLGIALFPFDKIFPHREAKDRKPLREALYYTVDDNLAG
jgi:hypothetical protein